MLLVPYHLSPFSVFAPLKARSRTDFERRYSRTKRFQRPVLEFKARPFNPLSPIALRIPAQVIPPTALFYLSAKRHKLLLSACMQTESRKTRWTEWTRRTTHNSAE
jgi:hypothetical protein